MYATSRIVDIDIHHGLIASNNDFMSRQSNNITEGLSTIKFSIDVTNAAFQWRGKKVKTYQVQHADRERGTFNIIIPITNNYTLGFHPGTHHVVTTKVEVENKQNPTITGNMKNLGIQQGECLLFHTNVIHAGDPAREEKKRKEKPYAPITST